MLEGFPLVYYPTGSLESRNKTHHEYEWVYYPTGSLE